MKPEVVTTISPVFTIPYEIKLEIVNKNVYRSK
jgi:hypothetical protein